jgi:hypothetical protein
MVVAGSAAEGMLGLENGIGDQLRRVLVFQPIEHPLSILSGRHDAREAEFGEMLRYRCRTLVDDVCEVVHRQLAIAQRQDQPHSSRIRKHPKDFDGELDELAVRFPATNLLIRIHTQIISQSSNLDCVASFEARFGGHRPSSVSASEDGNMKVEILHIDDCANWQEAGRRVTVALAMTGHDDVAVNYVLLSTVEDAARVPFAGSPTVSVDGSDLFAGANRITDLACRIYQTPTGFAGVPTIDQLVAALSQRD